MVLTMYSEIKIPLAGKSDFQGPLKEEYGLVKYIEEN